MRYMPILLISDQMMIDLSFLYQIMLKLPISEAESYDQYKALS